MTALPQSGTFAMVDPTHVAEVGPAAAILYARILWRSQQAGEWPASRSQLSAETGLSLPMIRTAVEVLRDRQWVATRRVSTLDATLVWQPIYACQVESAESAISTLRNPLDPPAESAISSTETGNTTTSSPDGGLFDETPTPVLRSVPTPAMLDAEFARFWELYPRKTAKKAARAAYGRARRSVSVEDLAAGLRRQLPAMAQKDPQYVPHPTTWLNQGRWEDQDPAVPMRADYDRVDPAAMAALPPRPRGELYG